MDEAKNLVWHCSKCGHIEDVGDEAPYQVGEDEPCVHCDGGIAVVETETDAERLRRKATWLDEGQASSL
jgi:hypothetical protein